MTDAGGNLEFTGFAGDYEIRCMGEAREISIRKAPQENYQEIVMG